MVGVVTVVLCVQFGAVGVVWCNVVYLVQSGAVGVVWCRWCSLRSLV